MIGSIKDFIDNALDFLTNPEGLGFSILIGFGLAMILYLMHVTGKSEKIADNSIESKKDDRASRITPHKPL